MKRKIHSSANCNKSWQVSTALAFCLSFAMCGAFGQAKRLTEEQVAQYDRCWKLAKVVDKAFEENKTPEARLKQIYRDTDQQNKETYDLLSVMALAYAFPIPDKHNLFGPFGAAENACKKNYGLEPNTVLLITK